MHFATPGAPFPVSAGKLASQADNEMFRAICMSRNVRGRGSVSYHALGEGGDLGCRFMYMSI